MNGESVASFTPDGGVVFGSLEFYKNVFLFGDLERLEPGQAKLVRHCPTAAASASPTECARRIPTVSPDGRRVVFTSNRAGTRSLHIADLRDEGLENVRALVPASFMEQAFTPRWSPDGTHVAYSVWKRGGYRDIRYVDVRDGTWRDLTNDRAVDGGAELLADGRFLYFHSDRTGIMNVYAWELATRSRAAGHERAHRRVHARAVARRKDARVRGLHDRRASTSSRCRSTRRRGPRRPSTSTRARRRRRSRSSTGT